MIKLITPIIAGAYFLVGNLIVKCFSKKDDLYLFSIGIAFSTLLLIIIFDLIPEIYTLFDGVLYNIYIISALVVLGFCLFAFLDTFSHHHEKAATEHHDHMFHIGIASGIAIVLHNLAEGMFIYLSSINDLKMGILISIAVGLHNIPLGMEVAVAMELSNKNKFKKYSLLILLVVSTFMGGLLFYIFESYIDMRLLGSFLSITTGAALYIVFLELFKELLNHKMKKISIVGIICGVILVILSSLF